MKVINLFYFVGCVFLVAQQVKKTWIAGEKTSKKLHVKKFEKKKKLKKRKKINKYNNIRINI